jgi:quercetin dioxygenase-like cupin family protein
MLMRLLGDILAETLQAPRQLQAGDVFVIPPGMVAHFAHCSPDLELYEAGLRGDFSTTLLA